MQTRKLFYEDSHIKTFSATVLSCEPAENGYLVTLDQTAFYPEGGGQACDLGTLADANVFDVKEKGEQVLHFCHKALPVGQKVEGNIQWQRRFDLMQQHTGEHILSGLIHSRYGYHNSGFHVGENVMEVDFDGAIPEDALWELEYKANLAVWQNLPVVCGYPSQEELPGIFYRTKRELPWPVRIVQIGDVDSCACCGVHVKTTGEVGLIKILSCVKFHGGVRLEMVCGERAYRYMQDIFLQNREVSRQISAKMTETAQGVQKLTGALNAEKFRACGLEKQVFGAIAASYQGKENVLHIQESLTGGGVRELADSIAQKITGIAVVCSGSEENGYQICIASTVSPVRELGTKAMQALDGRGGGRDFAFQGTVKATQAQIQAFFEH